MSTNSNPSYSYRSISASTQVSGTPATPNNGTLGRIVCGTSGTGIIKVWDSNNGATGPVILDNYPLTAGASVVLDGAYTNGLFVQLVSGTATFSVFWI